MLMSSLNDEVWAVKKLNAFYVYKFLVENNRHIVSLRNLLPFLGMMWMMMISSHTHHTHTHTHTHTPKPPPHPGQMTRLLTGLLAALSYIDLPGIISVHHFLTKYCVPQYGSSCDDRQG